MAGGRPNKKAVLVQELLKKDPTAKNQDIAEKVGCSAYYVAKIRRESTEAATLGSVRKTKKKSLPITEPRQSDDDSEFSYHEKRIIDRLGFGDTERKTAFDTGYPMSLVKKTKEKAIKKYGDTNGREKRFLGMKPLNPSIGVLSTVAQVCWIKRKRSSPRIGRTRMVILKIAFVGLQIYGAAT